MFGCTQNIPNRWSIFSSHFFSLWGLLKNTSTINIQQGPTKLKQLPLRHLQLALSQFPSPFCASSPELEFSWHATYILIFFLIQMLNNISFDIYPEIYSHSPDISRYKFWLIACHQFQNPKLILTNFNPPILTSIVAVTMTWSYFDMTANMLSGIAKKTRPGTESASLLSEDEDQYSLHKSTEPHLTGGTWRGFRCYRLKKWWNKFNIPSGNLT